MTSIREGYMEEVGALVALNVRSFAGTLGASLGDPYQSAFLRYFLRHPDALCIVAEEDGALAGLVYGAPDGYDAALKRELLLPTAASLLRHPRALVHRNFLPHLLRRIRVRFGRDRHARPDAPAPVFDLVGIATAPEHRGRGVARRLLAAFTEKAFARSYASVVLDVYVANTSAVRLYESDGWQILWSDGEVRRYAKLRASGCDPVYIA